MSKNLLALLATRIDNAGHDGSYNDNGNENVTGRIRIEMIRVAIVLRMMVMIVNHNSIHQAHNDITICEVWNL